MRQFGLRVRSGAGELRIQQQALFTDDPRHAPTADLILICVKSYDTDEAAAAVRAAVREGTVLLSLQNGVDNGARIARCYGEARSLSGVVYVGAEVASPGVVEHSSGGRIIVGACAGQQAAAEKAARAFASAAVPCDISENITDALWRKLLWNASFCAVSALTRASVDEIMESDSLLPLAAQCMDEVRRAAAIDGVELKPEVVQEVFAFSKTLGPFKPSMLQDLTRRKPLEHEAFNGIVVKRLESAGQEAPVNRLFLGLLSHLDRQIRREVPCSDHG
jgi:2-dehydropantoate 2-reductase